MEDYLKMIDDTVDRMCNQLEPKKFVKKNEYDYDQLDFFKSVQDFLKKKTMADFGLDEKTYSMCNTLKDRYMTEYTDEDKKRCNRNDYVKDLYVRYLMYKSVNKNPDQTVRDFINWCYIKPRILNKKPKIQMYKHYGNIIKYLTTFDIENLFIL